MRTTKLHGAWAFLVAAVIAAGCDSSPLGVAGDGGSVDGPPGGGDAIAPGAEVGGSAGQGGNAPGGGGGTTPPGGGGGVFPPTDGAQPTVDAGQFGDGAPPPITNCSLAQGRALRLPEDTVEGELRGQSRNFSTTCTRMQGSGGPEMVFGLRLTEARVVELQVSSRFDTVVAVRKACDDALSEIACSDNPLPWYNSGGGIVRPPVGGGPVDAAAGAPTAGDRDGGLRVALEPGDYVVLVDEAAAFGVGGRFTLFVRSFPPPTNLTCASATPVKDGTEIKGIDLSVAREALPAAVCSERGPTASRELFYKATVLPGQRLRASAAGSPPFFALPQLRLVPSCSSLTCLASGQNLGSPATSLAYFNETGQPQEVILALGMGNVPRPPDLPGSDFVDLTVSIAAPPGNITCAGATPLKNGDVILQDISDATGPPVGCGALPPGPALYYKATLAEKQSMTLLLTSSGFGPLFVRALESCDSAVCLLELPVGMMAPGQPAQVNYQNPGPGPKTVVWTVGGFEKVMSGGFRLEAIIPPPPAAIVVEAAAALETTEAGGTARFSVRLQSQPAGAVTVKLDSSDASEGLVGQDSVRFDPANWSRPVEVTVIGVDDRDKDGPQSYRVELTAGSADPAYAGLKGPAVAVRNLDDEPGVLVDPVAGLSTSESGRKATFVVRVQSRPARPVTIPVASSNAKEGTASPDHLTFDEGNWTQPQSVVVSGTDDMDVECGDHSYSVVLGPAASEDPEYAGVDAPDPAVSNADDEGSLETFVLQPMDLPASCSMPFFMFECGVDKNPFLSSDPKSVNCLASMILNNQDLARQADQVLFEIVAERGTPTSVAVGFRFISDAPVAAARMALQGSCASSGQCKVLGCGRVVVAVVGLDMTMIPSACYTATVDLLSSRISR